MILCKRPVIEFFNHDRYIKRVRIDVEGEDLLIKNSLKRKW